MATFGKTALGASNRDLDGTYSNIIIGCNFQAPADCTSITKITAYLNTGSNQSMRPVIYNAPDATSSPTSLVLAGAQVVVNEDSGLKLKDFTISSALTPLNWYFLGLWVQDTIAAGRESNFRYDAAGAGSSHRFGMTYASTGNPTDPFGTDTAETSAYTIYATYTSAAVRSGFFRFM